MQEISRNDKMTRNNERFRFSCAHCWQNVKQHKKVRLPLNVATLYYGTCLIEVIVPGDVPVRNLGEPKWAAKWAK
jgi:hypothetical protein